MSKRLFDVLAAGAGLLLLAPLLFALVALWIRLDSPGPVFFRQERVGRHGVLFHIYKFRTMHGDPGAERPADGRTRPPHHPRRQNFLRFYKLDELPQLINVLKGDMSLVGPRPEVPRYVACYPPGCATSCCRCARHHRLGLDPVQGRERDPGARHRPEKAYRRNHPAGQARVLRALCEASAASGATCASSSAPCARCCARPARCTGPTCSSWATSR
jgi:hypothetical protein